MSNILILNASPRKKGTSKMLAQLCEAQLGGTILDLYEEKMENVLKYIEEANIIILSGPCYINSYPAQVNLLLEMIAEHREIWHQQRWYGIINGGMPYIHTHQSGIKMLELFCENCNMVYKGGFVIGGGAILDGRDLVYHPGAKKLVPAFNDFIQAINKQEDVSMALCEAASNKIPKIMAWILSKALTVMVKQQVQKGKKSAKQKGK